MLVAIFVRVLYRNSYCIRHLTARTEVEWEFASLYSVGVPKPFPPLQVPFGDIATVRDWMKISGSIGKPSKEHPKRPIQGLDCKRSEPSGQRFWSFFSQLCGTPDRFFREAYVHNYCPVAYMDFKGKNITPVDMKV